jgi:hypothetical protein
MKKRGLCAQPEGSDTFYSYSKCKICSMGGVYYGSVYCERCYRELNYLPPTHRKASEILVMDMISRILAEEGYIAQLNLPLPGLNIYPDILLRISDYTLVIEIDENQHRGRTDKDKSRTDKLKDRFNKLVLLRINPDSYAGRQPMLKSYKTLEAIGGCVQKVIIINSGEIETREKLIRETILNLILQIHTDSFITTTRDSSFSSSSKTTSFTQIRMFYDLGMVATTES